MIIITGGAGFIGSNLVAGLEAHTTADLVICDVLGNDDKWHNIAKRELRDIVKPEHLLPYMERHKDEIKIIFHLGGIASSTEKNADLIIENNYTLGRKIWKWCGENGKRVIFGSTGATYGDGAHGFNDSETPEDLAKLQPLSPYAWSKHLFDRRVSSLVHGDSKGKEAVPPQWVNLKFFHVYGPNEYHKGDQRSVACKLYPQITAGAAARLFKSHHPDYADGGQKRDFIWIGDCVDIMLWLYDHPEVSGIYNVGTGKARTFNDMAKAMFKAAGMEPKINYIDMPQDLRDQYQYFTEANTDKLRSAGYSTPFTELEEGMRIYVQDYLAKRDAYR